MPSDTAGQPLELRNIAKRFGATQALEDVSHVLGAGEVHALIKIMAGVHQPDRIEHFGEGPFTVYDRNDVEAAAR